MSSPKVFVGFVIPTYNERESVIQLLEGIEIVLSEMRVGYRVVVVDDNSPDGTAKAVEEYSRSHPLVEVIVRPGKLGIGSAIMAGFERLISDSRVTHVVTMDADLSHDPRDLAKLLRDLDSVDVVVGSRYVDGGRVVGWSFYRKVISWGANAIVRLLYRTRVRDNTSNYRVYSRRAVESILEHSRASGYEWVIEALLICKALDARVVERPIVFTNRSRGGSKLGLSDIVKWFKFAVSYRKKFLELRRRSSR